jgi:D-amino peptidase
MSEFDVFISADIEGISSYVDPSEDADPAMAAAMARDVDAAVEGVLDADPDASVTVADSHGGKRTIPPAELHERASLVRGGPRPFGMVDGAGEADLALLVGFHDRPGSGGHLEHTFTTHLADVRLDGHAVGEVELNAALLGARGVPVGLVTGDERLGETVAERLPSAEYVTTKTARGAGAAVCRHPSQVRSEIRTAARAATADPPSDPDAPVSLDPPVRVAVDFANAKLADLATLWPGVERGRDSRTVVHEAADVPTAYQFVRATATLSP